MVGNAEQRSWIKEHERSKIILKLWHLQCIKILATLYLYLRVGSRSFEFRHFLQKDLEDQELYKQLGYEIIDE